jgi:tRNA/tmRNA/rRNA uracil-C5-methylase (TrmA/RlmC/RlmD family)
MRPPGLARGDLVELSVEKGVYRGVGLARAAGQVVLVAGGLPGDRIRAEVTDLAKGYANARVQEVLEPGPGRRPAPCRHASGCGGCSYQELGYSEQLRLKEAVLRESLQRGGVTWEEAIEVTPSPETSWRTRAAMHFAVVGEALRLGFRESGSHQVVEVAQCLQLSPALLGTALAVLSALRGRSDLWTSILGVTLAESISGQERVVALEADSGVRDLSAFAGLAEALPDATGLCVVARAGGRKHHLVLQGEPFVHSHVLGQELRSHVLSFFQANRFLVQELVKVVLDWTVPGSAVLDLYCGVGLFALPLAARGDPVLGIEWNSLAVADARHNARSLPNVVIQRGDVEAALLRKPASREEQVILDPPRAGAGTRVVAGVASRRPERIVYVSCDPPTLARDLREFRRLGYGIAGLRALDLFPTTFHLEAVALLRPI